MKLSERLINAIDGDGVISSEKAHIIEDAVNFVRKYEDAEERGRLVPVVRCGECRYAYDSVGGWCCSHGICVDCIVREDFFCADGARMDGDGE